MKKKSHQDANIALSMILMLMLSLIGMNTSYVQLQMVSGEPIHGVFPVAEFLRPV
ncbi:MAG: hypothetical protein U0Z17_03265 [Bacteroidales bacterium]